jgi:uncharacterized protein (TIGR03437 family)
MFTLQVIDSAGQRATGSFTIAVVGPGAVNGASFLPSLARGAIASVTGSQLSGGPLRLKQALFRPCSGNRCAGQWRRRAAFFVSPSQINFQIPFETPLHEMFQS